MTKSLFFGFQSIRKSVWALILTAGVAFAQSTQGPITTTTPINNVLTDWGINGVPQQTLSFPKFNPSLGTLTSVTISLSGSINTTIFVCNGTISGSAEAYGCTGTGASNSNGKVQTISSITVQDSGSNINTSFSISSAKQTYANVAPGSSQTFGPITASGSSNPPAFTSAPILSEFTGTGAIVLNAGTITNTSVQNQSGNTATTQTTFDSLTGTVIYTYTPGTPALSISKTASNSGVFAQGSSASFNVQVSNTGTAVAAVGAVTVTDAVPAGLTVTSATGAGWDCSATSGQNVSCTNTAQIAVSGNSSFTINVNPTASATNGNNTAQITTGSCGSNCSSTVPYTFPSVSILKTAGNSGAFTQGGTANFTLQVSNAAGVASAAIGAVTVTDIVPVALTVTSATGAGWNCAATIGQNVSCTNTAAITAGGNSSITVAVNVAANAPSGSNTAQITTLNCISGGAGCSSTAPYTFPGVSITKTASNSGAFTLGGTASFTLQVSNAAGGASAAIGAVTVTDAVPAALTVTSATGAAWNCSATVGQNVSCTNTAAITAGGNSSITVAVNVAANATSGSNTAQITTLNCISGGAGCSSTAPYTFPGVSITKTASNSGAFTLGGTASFTLQ
ncbi:MAG: choice-of-anchor E domain-containing protein, partial [Acidobacteriota bacterium]|nr:choice-of-anchor E domain-containing protein [Acidobacteriota bacterium]